MKNKDDYDLVEEFVNDVLAHLTLKEWLPTKSECRQVLTALQRVRENVSTKSEKTNTSQEHVKNPENSLHVEKEKPCTTTEEERKAAFIRGVALTVANAVRMETWSAKVLAVGFTIKDFEKAGCEENDLETIRKALGG